MVNPAGQGSNVSSKSFWEEWNMNHHLATLGSLAVTGYALKKGKFRGETLKNLVELNVAQRMARSFPSSKVLIERKIKPMDFKFLRESDLTRVGNVFRWNEVVRDYRKLRHGIGTANSPFGAAKGFHNVLTKLQGIGNEQMRISEKISKAVQEGLEKARNNQFIHLVQLNTGIRPQNLEMARKVVQGLGRERKEVIERGMQRFEEGIGQVRAKLEKQFQKEIGGSRVAFLKGKEIALKKSKESIIKEADTLLSNRRKMIKEIYSSQFSVEGYLMSKVPKTVENLVKGVIFESTLYFLKTAIDSKEKKRDSIETINQLKGLGSQVTLEGIQDIISKEISAIDDEKKELKEKISECKQLHLYYQILREAINKSEEDLGDMGKEVEEVLEPLEELQAELQNWLTKLGQAETIYFDFHKEVIRVAPQKYNELILQFEAKNKSELTQLGNKAKKLEKALQIHLTELSRGELSLKGEMDEWSARALLYLSPFFSGKKLKGPGAGSFLNMVPKQLIKTYQKLPAVALTTAFSLAVVKSLGVGVNKADVEAIFDEYMQKEDVQIERTLKEVGLKVVVDGTFSMIDQFKSDSEGWGATVQNMFLSLAKKQGKSELIKHLDSLEDLRKIKDPKEIKALFKQYLKAEFEQLDAPLTPAKFQKRTADFAEENKKVLADLLSGLAEEHPELIKVYQRLGVEEHKDEFLDQEMLAYLSLPHDFLKSDKAKEAKAIEEAIDQPKGHLTGGLKPTANQTADIVSRIGEALISLFSGYNSALI